ncbi:MAG TPA: cytochrome c nitrite reductase small subunit [Planctomycetota bacterium]
MKRLVLALGVPAVVACAFFGSLAGAGAVTVVTSGATAYLRDDPKACVSCHIMREQYDGWQKASHHGHATCNDCHTPASFFSKYWVKAENGYWHSKGFTLQDFHEPIRIREKNQRVLRENCVRCHAGLVSEIGTHADGEAMNCVRCHARVGHGP